MLQIKPLYKIMNSNKNIINVLRLKSNFKLNVSVLGRKNVADNYSYIGLFIVYIDTHICSFI